MTVFRNTILPLLILTCTAAPSLPVYALGFIPETSMLFIKEADKGGSMNVKNSDDAAQLLYTTIVDLPGQQGAQLMVTQPVTRVEGGQTQHVRFVLTTSGPLKVEQMKRVIFEGIPQKTPGKNKIGFSIRQDLPVIIHPASLPEIQDAWAQLNWKVHGSSVELSNPGAYVVRFQQDATLLPSKTKVALTRSYLLPGESIKVDVGKNLSGDKQVAFVPVSRYGVPVNNYTANLVAQ